MIYIREAHPTDGWRRPASHIKLEDPKTFEARSKVAGKCAKDLGLTIPVLVDDMNDTVSKAYAADPDRLFLLAPAGTVAFRGDRGPRGFDVAKLEKALVGALSKSRDAEPSRSGQANEPDSGK